MASRTEGRANLKPFYDALARCMNRATRILVTGAQGFVGRALCRRLVEEGHDVARMVRRPAVGGAAAANEHVGDLTDRRYVEAVFKAVRPAVVFHLAAHNTGARERNVVRSTFDSIVAGSMNVFEAALDNGCPRVVVAGSLQEPDDRLCGAPNSPYAAAKYASSAYARMYASLYRLPVTIARLFVVYGPDEPNVAKVIPHVISRLLSGGSADLSTGAQAFDWIFIDDVVDALLALGSRSDLAGATVDVGTGKLTTVRTMIERIAARLNASDRVRFGVLPDRVGEPTRIADVDAVASAIGWRPKYSIDEGLDRTVAWYRARAALAQA